ncbi:MAG: sugar transferase [Chloroflexi bacterium]|nr:sugar transferase [Chloroflexota bacterium]
MTWEKFLLPRKTFPLTVAVGLDACTILGAFLIALALHFLGHAFTVHPQRVPPARHVALILVLVVPSWIVIFAAGGLYQRQIVLYRAGLGRRLLRNVTVATLLTLSGAYLTGTFLLSRGWILLAAVLTFLLIAGERWLLSTVMHRLRRHIPWRVLIVGAGEAGIKAADLLATQRSIEVVGFVDDFVPLGVRVTDHVRILGRVNNLSSLVADCGIDELFVTEAALTRESYERLLREAYTTPNFPELVLVPQLSETLVARLEADVRAGTPVLLLNLGRISGWSAFLKSTLDYSVLVPVLVVSLPVFLVSWLRARRRGMQLCRGVPLIGQYGRHFLRWSFTGWGTEYTDIDGTMHFGDFSRQYRLSYLLAKLPRIFNVLRGEMSLVGPRPIYEGTLSLYSEWAGVLLAMKPGLFGPWLLHGTSHLTPEEELAADLAYVRHYSLGRDMRILWGVVQQLTIRIVHSYKQRTPVPQAHADTVEDDSLHALQRALDESSVESDSHH